MLEVRASGLYHTISWVKDERVFGRFGLSFVHPIHYPEELPNFLEMFIREPTMTTDMGVYEVGLTRIRDLSANIPNDILFSVIAAGIVIKIVLFIFKLYSIIQRTPPLLLIK